MKIGAVDQLLVSDDFMKEMKEKGMYRKADWLLRKVEDMQGEITMITKKRCEEKVERSWWNRWSVTMDDDSKELVEQARKHVKNVLGLEYSGHDYWHIYRVWKLAQRIAKEENVDRLTVEIAALLHDLGDSKTSSYDKESDPARKWLSKVSKDKQLIHDVCHIIDNISYRKELEDSDVKLSKEGEVVQDADRLDAIGAIGISRAFVFPGYKNNVVHNPSIEPNADMSSEMYRKNDSTAINHFYEKLLLLKDRMNTDAGKELAKERHEFMEEFLDRFFS